MTRLARGRLLVVALLASACGKSAAEATHPSPAPMPPNAQWRGLYQGPYHSALNIWTQGNQAVGNWRAVGDREGEFSGTAFGNLLFINFSEHGAKNAERYSGRGYFVYSVGKADEPHQIYGEWGVGQTGRTSPWWALKRANEPQGKNAFLDKDGDDQQQGADAPGCEGGNCDTQDHETQ